MRKKTQTKQQKENKIEISDVVWQKGWDTMQVHMETSENLDMKI